MRFASFDTETTGLDPRFNEVIEFGIVMLHPETLCPTTDVLALKLKIEHPERVVPNTLGVYNHYNVETWARDAVPQAEGWQRLADWIFQRSEGGADKVTLVGQNIINFDQPLLEHWCQQFGLKPSISYHPEDLMSLYACIKRRLKLKVGKMDLRTIATCFGLTNPEAHSALADAMTAGTCYALGEAYLDAMIDCGRRTHHELLDEAYRRIGHPRNSIPLPGR